MKQRDNAELHGMSSGIGETDVYIQGGNFRDLYDCNL